ncbi:MAG TPA: transaldolase family protein, partial [Actinomycetes bacterium]|nr:transaldolase family protein [Actinomycetes bacterium]
YDDTRYVVELIAPEVVNTMPPGTLEAVRDHGRVSDVTIGDDLTAEAAVIAGLRDLGIDYDNVVHELETDGVAAFEKSWLQLRDSIERALEQATGS